MLCSFSFIEELRISALIFENVPLLLSFNVSISSNSSVKKNVVPCPTSLSKSRRPPISSTNLLEIVSPRPVPPYLRVIDVSAWLNASKIRDFCSLVTPIPLSWTSNFIFVLPLFSEGNRRILTLILPPLFVNLTAFERRLITTSLILVGSPLIGRSKSGSM